jgi:CRP/FNR family cyclic AMP-dependent transcriptional regulator
LSEEVSKLLAGVSLLGGLPAASLAKLATRGRRRRYGQGEPLFRRGDPGDGMFIVLDGLVRIHLSDASGKEVTLTLSGPRESIGELALIDGSPRSADATAFTPVTVLFLDRTDASQLIHSDVGMAVAILKVTAARLRRLTDQVEAVSLRPLPQRVAGALIRLSDADPSGLVRVNQGELANLVAASRSKVNKVLSDLRARGFIENVRAGIRLTDRRGLHDVSGDTRGAD